MERRDFLSAGAGAAVTAAGTITAHPAHAAIPPGLDLGNFVQRLDRTLDALTSATLCDLPAPAGESGKWSRYEILCRKSLRSLHLASTFHDLPREARNDERIQKRMRDALPEMDEAVFGMAAALEEIGDSGLRELRDTFLNDADVRAEVMQRFYGGIEAAEITDARVERSRSLLRQIQRELGRKTPSGMVSEAIRGIRRIEKVRDEGPAEWQRAWEAGDDDEPAPADAGPVEATPPPDLRQLVVGRQVRVKLLDGTEYSGAIDSLPDDQLVVLWAEGEGLVYFRRRDIASIVEAAPPAVAPDPFEREPDPRGPGEAVMRAGCWTMGIGLGTAVGGIGLGLLISNCDVMCVGVGIGALLLVVGLGFLIVGAIRARIAENRREP